MPGLEYVRDYSYPTGFDSLEKVEGWARDIWKQLSEAEHGFPEDLENVLSQKWYFKTITGITNDVVADKQEDTLTLASNVFMTIVGTAVTDTITFTPQVKDEDDMASDSDVHLSTQQSIKAYASGGIQDAEISKRYALMMGC